jgi:hypothetical protein
MVGKGAAIGEVMVGSAGMRSAGELVTFKGITDGTGMGDGDGPGAVYNGVADTQGSRPVFGRDADGNTISAYKDQNKETYISVKPNLVELSGAGASWSPSPSALSPPSD